MAKILIILPYSGAQFTGGLAVVNEQLTKALAEKHDVKLLTCELPPRAMATREGHGRAELLVIPSQVTSKMKDPGGRDGDEERKVLYQLINSEEVILGKDVAQLLGDWQPEVILGHSRFSGPAAIKLKQKRFNNAKVGYFLHSYPPVEGLLLSGYEAFEEAVNAQSAEAKLNEEKEWIGQADVVLAVGPMMRWGATLMLDSLGRKQPRVHEVIPGIMPADTCKTKVPIEIGKEVTFLLCGRASAPVKGFQDMVIAALQLRNADREEVRKLKVGVHIKVRGMSTAKYGERQERIVTSETVQKWTDGVFGDQCKDDRVRIEVLESVPQDKIMAEYQSAHGVLTAAYLEHFGLVPFEALGCGRPVLVSEMSGSGQFLKSRFPELGGPCVVEDFTFPGQRPFTSTVLKRFSRDAFDARPDAWERAIFDLANNIEARIAAAGKLMEQLADNYTISHFAVSVLAAFQPQWDGKITRQMAGGEVQEVQGKEL